MVVCKYEVSCLRLLVGYLVERSKRNSIFTLAHVLFTISLLGRDEAGLEDFFGGEGAWGRHTVFRADRWGSSRR